MKRIIGIATVLAIANVAVAQTGIIQSPAYKECIALSNSNPAQALIKADEWLAIDNGVAAHHCRAMALYGLKRYSEAGESLNALRMIIPEENVALRSFVAKQAASAWTNATRADAALSMLDTQIEEMNNARGNNAANAKLTADLLLERARLNITYGKAALAARDLDHAVSLTPLNVNVLIERAQTFELLGDPALARADAESALTLNPENPKARAVLARLDQKK
jgi:predicted Zn-dependent protease